MLHVKVHHNTQCSSLGSLVFAHIGGIGEADMQLNIYITLYYHLFISIITIP